MTRKSNDYKLSAVNYYLVEQKNTRRGLQNI